MDLRTSFPRSPLDRLHGIDHLKRMIDKARAFNAGKLGEYHYNCPMDQGLLAHLGITSEDFAGIVRQSVTDDAIHAEIQRLVPKAFASTAIEHFNRHFEEAGPDSPEKKAFFDSILKAIDPTRNDIKTWARLLDLEEKRIVPRLAD